MGHKNKDSKKELSKKSEDICLEKYPSAKLILNECQNDYNRNIAAYDRIYDKVNVFFAFCSVALFVVIKDFDYTKFAFDIHSCSSKELLFNIVYIVLSLCSVISIILVTLNMLILMKGKKLIFLDSVSIRNEELYLNDEEDSALWLIDKYNAATESIEKAVSEKQNKLDRTIILSIVTIISYAAQLIMERGI